MSKANVAVAGKKGIVLLPVADLKMTYDVRRALNEDRVLLFMEIYEAGGEVSPIEVVRGTMTIHDGRHRKAALERLNRKHAQCVLVETRGFAEDLMDAYGKNVSDSPFPPTRADTVFVMRQLLERGVTNAEVQKRFMVYYQPSHVRKLLKDAHSNILKAKMQKAVSAIAHGGATAEAAAEEHGVKLDALRDEIAGVKKRRRATSVSDLKREITSRHSGFSQSTVRVFQKLLEQFEDGETLEKSVLEVMLHVRRLNADAAKRIDSWLERFEALKGSMKAK